MSAAVLCRFPHRPPRDAVVRVAMSDGCVCYPMDTEQVLCLHHFGRSDPLGSVEIVEWLDPAAELFWLRYVAGPAPSPQPYRSTLVVAYL